MYEMFHNCDDHSLLDYLNKVGKTGKKELPWELNF